MVSQQVYLHSIFIGKMSNTIKISNKQSILASIFEIFAYRDLFLFLGWKEILIRYKQTFFGVVWAVFRPLVAMLIFTVVFHQIANLKSGSIPYFIFVLSGILPWQLFANLINDMSASLVANQSMITKIYFPRILIPFSSIFNGIVEFIIGFVALLVLAEIKMSLSLTHILVYPFLLIWIIILASGLGLFLATLNVKYRDVKIIVPFFLQIGLYLSPIGYPSSQVPLQYLKFYYLNPISVIIDMSRWSLNFSDTLPTNSQIGTGLIFTLFIFILGFWYFLKNERSFADII